MLPAILKPVGAGDWGMRAAPKGATSTRPYAAKQDPAQRPPPGRGGAPLLLNSGDGGGVV